MDSLLLHEGDNAAKANSFQQKQHCMQLLEEVH